MKKIPVRQCVGCREMIPKKEMLRVIRTPLETVILDTTGKQNGRGAYLCKKMDCFKQARKTKGLERSLKTVIPEDVYDSLEKEMENLEARS